MTEKELKEELAKRQRIHQLENLEANNSRAQSVTIGTAGGGTTEITMRGVNGKFLWNVYQPVEVVELINQLAANIGCHIHILPRNDFASWRDWRISEEELEHARGGVQALQGVGFPPFVSDMSPHRKVGLEKPTIKPDNTTEQENVATKKAFNKRTPKRSRSSSK